MGGKGIKRVIDYIISTESDRKMDLGEKDWGGRSTTKMSQMLDCDLLLCMLLTSVVLGFFFLTLRVKQKSIEETKQSITIGQQTG